MKKIFVFISMVIAMYLNASGFSKTFVESDSRRLGAPAFDSTKVELDGHGDTVAFYVYSNSKLIEKGLRH